MILSRLWERVWDARESDWSEPASHLHVPFCLPVRLGASQVKVWFQNRRMKWRHSKEAQAQKDKDKEAGEKPSGGAPAADGEPEERSPSRSEGEAESESSDPESLDMAPSDTERTEGAERSLHQTTVIKASAAGVCTGCSLGRDGGLLFVKAVGKTARAAGDFSQGSRGEWQNLDSRHKACCC